MKQSPGNRVPGDADSRCLRERPVVAHLECHAGRGNSVLGESPDARPERVHPHDGGTNAIAYLQTPVGLGGFTEVGHYPGKLTPQHGARRVVASYHLRINRIERDGL